MIAYLDASVAVAVMKADEDGYVVREFLDRLDGEMNTILSGRLLETELRSSAHRLGISGQVVESTLENVAIVEHEKTDFRRAGFINGTGLGSLDALHLAAACEAEGLSLLSVT